MTRFLFILTLFILFIIEGTILQVFSPDRWGIPILMVPRFVVVLLIFSALFLGRIQGLFMGLFFGLIYDVVYGSAIGMYGFSMSMIGYFSGLTFRIFQQNIFLILLTVLVSLIAHETIVYGILYLTKQVEMDIHFFYMQRVIPIIILNMLFALLVSYPVRAILIQMKEEDEK